MPRDTNDQKLARKNPYLNQVALIGASTATLDINAAMLRNASSVTVIHDGGTGTDGILRLTYDGSDWSDDFPLLAGESVTFDQIDVHSIQVERPVAGGDFTFRVVAL